ncbi:nucleotidyltransferase family protein [Fibrobacterota bacterium]
MNLSSVMRPEEKILVCSCRLQGTGGNEAQLRELCQAELDWDIVLYHARAHGLIPLLCSALKETCWEDVPHPVQLKLAESVLSIEKKNMRMAGELVRVKQALQAGDLTAVPFKGPVLELAVYGRTGMRQYDDLDILIKKSDVPQAARILASLDYVPTRVFSPRQEKAYVKRECQYSFVPRQGGSCIELHWGILPPYYGFYQDFDVLLENFSPAWKEHGFPEIPREDLLLMLCAHNGIKHRYDRLSWLCDMTRLIRVSDMDWEKLLKKAERYGSRKALLLGLYLAQRNSGLELPPMVTAMLDQEKGLKKISERIEKHYFLVPAPDPGAVQKAGFHLSIRDRWSDRVSYLNNLLWHPSMFDWEFIRLPDSLYWFYYLIRPFRLTLKAMKALFVRGEVIRPG